jgi:hypothetical protein
MKHILTMSLAVILSFYLGLSVYAEGEEALESDPVVEESTQTPTFEEPIDVIEEAPAPPINPVPEPVFGYAVVSPAGVVVSVTVCTDSVCGADGEWKGVMPQDTPWPGYRLIKQTNSTADGNVAGWHTHEGVDVRYNDDTGHFDITYEHTNEQGATVKHRATIVPELTATDPEGMNLHTGYIDRGVTYELTHYFEQQLNNDQLNNAYSYSYTSPYEAVGQLYDAVAEDLKAEDNTTEVVEDQDEPRLIQSVVISLMNMMRSLFSWMFYMSAGS